MSQFRRIVGRDSTIIERALIHQLAFSATQLLVDFHCAAGSLNTSVPVRCDEG